MKSFLMRRVYFWSSLVIGICLVQLTPTVTGQDYMLEIRIKKMGGGEIFPRPAQLYRSILLISWKPPV